MCVLLRDCVFGKIGYARYSTGLHCNNRSSCKASHTLLFSNVLRDSWDSQELKEMQKRHGRAKRLCHDPEGVRKWTLNGIVRSW